jgi:large subunit ribosomal protein L25
METIALEAKKRKEKGKVAAKLFRQKGLIPGVVFGKKTPSLPLLIPRQSLEKALYLGAAHKIVNLKIETEHSKEEKMCVIQEIQRDVFGKQVLHVDFHEISMEEKITSKVPLELVGTPKGVKAGGILDHVLWEVEVKALPIKMPEKITLDVSGLDITQSLHVKDIKPPEGVEILEDPEEIVVVLHPPRVEEVPGAEGTVAQPSTPAQPEVISKGKKETEESEGAEKPKK